MQGNSTTEITQFADDVLKGLSASPKYLSSKYFYDSEGSRLFEEIMKLPEYYLTNCERAIFETQAAEILEAFAGSENAFDLIEFGAGDGSKTAILIDRSLARSVDVTYSAIDISQEALSGLARTFSEKFPMLKVNLLDGDYLKILASLKHTSERRKVLLFLGSNIGNYSHDAAVELFRSLHTVMNSRDLLLVGFDLQKDPYVIAAAYDDDAGVTARFNLNLLKRIDRELGGDFDVAKFSHHSIYDPINGAARSYLISREAQTVNIEALGRSFNFDEWEAVFVEVSQKYSMAAIDRLAEASGFSIEQNFLDDRQYYCDSLWAPTN